MARKLTKTGLKQGLRIGSPNRHECSAVGQNDGEGRSGNRSSNLIVGGSSYGSCEGVGLESVEWFEVPSGKKRKKANDGGV